MSSWKKLGGQKLTSQTDWESFVARMKYELASTLIQLSRSIAFRQPIHFQLEISQSNFLAKLNAYRRGKKSRIARLMSLIVRDKGKTPAMASRFTVESVTISAIKLLHYFQAKLADVECPLIKILITFRSLQTRINFTEFLFLIFSVIIKNV